MDENDSDTMKKVINIIMISMGIIVIMFIIWYFYTGFDVYSYDFNGESSDSKTSTIPYQESFNSSSDSEYPYMSQTDTNVPKKYAGYDTIHDFVWRPY